MKALSLAVGFALVSMAAEAKMVKVTTTPPPNHSCEDLYRSRDYGAIFAVLYIDDERPIASVYCGVPSQPPVARPR